LPWIAFRLLVQRRFHICRPADGAPGSFSGLAAGPASWGALPTPPSSRPSCPMLSPIWATAIDPVPLFAPWETFPPGHVIHFTANGWVLARPGVWRLQLSACCWRRGHPRRHGSGPNRKAVLLAAALFRAPLFFFCPGCRWISVGGSSALNRPGRQAYVPTSATSTALVDNRATGGPGCLAKFLLLMALIWEIGA